MMRRSCSSEECESPCEREHTGRTRLRWQQTWMRCGVRGSLDRWTWLLAARCSHSALAAAMVRRMSSICSEQRQGPPQKRPLATRRLVRSCVGLRGRAVRAGVHREHFERQHLSKFQGVEGNQLVFGVHVLYNLRPLHQGNNAPGPTRATHTPGAGRGLTASRTPSGSSACRASASSPLPATTRVSSSSTLKRTSGWTHHARRVVSARRSIARGRAVLRSSAHAGQDPAEASLAPFLPDHFSATSPPPLMPELCVAPLDRSNPRSERRVRRWRAARSSLRRARQPGRRAQAAVFDRAQTRHACLS